MRSRTLFITILLFSATTYGQELPHWPLPANVQVYTLNLDAKEQERVNQAIQAWRPYLPEGISISLAGPVAGVLDCRACVTILRETTPGEERGRTTVNGHDGITDYAVMKIDPRAGSGDRFQRDVEHEFGHVLGLHHYAKSIMQERESKYHPSEIDAERLRGIYMLARYSFRQTVLVNGEVVRQSVFTFNDAGDRIETEITGKQIKVPVFPISKNPRAPEGYGVVWSKDVADQGSELFFPVKAIDITGKIVVELDGYKLFRTSVAIKEVE